MKARIAGSSRQTVFVQKIRARIVRTSASMQPLLARVCLSERIASQIKDGANRRLRMRRRVMETRGVGQLCYSDDSSLFASGKFLLVQTMEDHHGIHSYEIYFSYLRYR